MLFRSDVSDRGQRRAVFLAHVHRRDHVGQRGHRRDIEPSMDLLNRHCRCEGSKRLALLDHRVHAVAHFRIRRIGQDAAITECARTVLHSSAMPRDYLSLANHFRSALTGLFKIVELSDVNRAGEILKRRGGLARWMARPQERNREPLVDDFVSQ